MRLETGKIPGGVRLQVDGMGSEGRNSLGLTCSSGHLVIQRPQQNLPLLQTGTLHHHSVLSFYPRGYIHLP